MRLYRLGGISAVLLLLGGTGVVTLQAENLPAADDIIRKAVLRSQETGMRDGEGGYTYRKVSVTEELDTTGRVRERKEKVYEVSFVGGSSSARLLAVNGKPPAGADRKKQNENEGSIRQLLGQPNGAKAGNRDNFLTPDLAARYDFKLVGETPVNGRPAYEIAFQVKSPEPPIRRLIDRLLNQLSGTLYIDEEEFEVARADLRLNSEVDLLGGVLGCLKKLAYSVTRERFADGVWLNSVSRGDFEGRKLLDSKHITMKSETTNFQPLAMNRPTTARPGL